MWNFYMLIQKNFGKIIIKTMITMNVLNYVNLVMSKYGKYFIM